MIVEDVAAATDIAVQQAKRAGVWGLFSVVSSAKRGSGGNWEVIVQNLSLRYRVEIDKSNGFVLAWELLGR